jgi:hypothetical protein
MPRNAGNDVWGSTLGDHTHKGPNQVRCWDAAHRIAGIAAQHTRYRESHCSHNIGTPGDASKTRCPPAPITFGFFALPTRIALPPAPPRGTYPPRSPAPPFHPCPPPPFPGCHAAQAGNKSLLGYRSDIGVPGYTGYCPTHLAISVPIKGFEHTGRPVDSLFRDINTVATVEPEKMKVSE